MVAILASHLDFPFLMAAIFASHLDFPHLVVAILASHLDFPYLVVAILASDWDLSMMMSASVRASLSCVRASVTSSSRSPLATWGIPGRPMMWLCLLILSVPLLEPL